MTTKIGLLFLAATMLHPVTAGAQRASAVAASPRRSFDFDRGWLVHVGDGSYSDAAASEAGWQAVTLPYAFNDTQAFKVDIHKQPEAIIWYRKHFRLPTDAPAGRAFLEFQGVRQAADVWVNGERVGLSENGVMAFGFDITRALRPGDNVVAVRVDDHWDYKERATGTKFQWEDNNFYANFGGINKPVRLHLTGPVYQTLPLYSSLGTKGPYIWADELDIPGAAATIHAESEVRNDGNAPATIGYDVTVRDLDGKIVAKLAGDRQTIVPGATATLTAAKRASGLHFWSWGYGYLYTVTGALTDASGRVVDAVDTRTGFRATTFDHGVLTLNGRVLQLKGYAQRATDEWPGVGLSVPPWVTDFSNRLVTGSNGNLVRWMHVTPAKQEIESADRLGLIEAMPAGDSEGDPSDAVRWGRS